ncbi:MAG: integrin alpha [Candidatus Midichloria sp.]
MNGSNGFIINGIAAYDGAGYSALGVGDVNGDGFSDIVIGAENADPSGRNLCRPSICVVFGKSFLTSILY